MPPTAPIIGNKACLGFDNSPCKNSLLISKDTKKKNIAINTSFIQWRTLSFNPNSLVPSIIYFSSVEKYNSLKLPLLITKARTAAKSKINPEAASNLKKYLKGFVICWIIANIYFYRDHLKKKKKAYLTYKNSRSGRSAAW